MHSRRMLTAAAAIATAAAAGGSASQQQQPRALVYRGPAACDGCPEAVAGLLASFPPRGFGVAFAGPGEAVDVDEASLAGVDVFAFPGGPDLGDAWARVSNYTAPLQGFVARGGHYLGFCLGAYLAGRSPGFALLPPGADATDEVARPGAEVASEADAVVRVDWTFVSGRTQRGRWLYFQDGAVVKGVEDGRDGARVLARYSRNGDVAASVTAYGRGRVALVGPHPEATQKWYAAAAIANPDGATVDIGHDFIAAALGGGPAANATGDSPGPPVQTTTAAAATSSASAAGAGRAHANPLGRMGHLARHLWRGRA